MVRLFRRAGKNSFSVQLSPTSGVVEVRCSTVDVIPDLFSTREALEERLLLMGKKVPGSALQCIGNFDTDETQRQCGWTVDIVQLGPFSMESHAFVQCHIAFQKLDEEDGLAAGDEVAPVMSSKEQPKKKSLRWVQSKGMNQ